MTATATLPLSETIAPATAAELAAAVRQAHADRTPLYPVGGGTSLDYGLAVSQQGIGLSTAALDRVIDFPARDMTITVEAGITLAQLAETLRAERQWFPVEAGQPAEATLGGLLATNFSGPRRFGWGTARDYVIGISAVDGRGVAFKAGGRVVKNVAGYDFCKLLVGSLGTLAVITQVTLKLKPIPDDSRLAVCEFATWDAAEALLASLVESQTTPSAVQLLSGPAWRDEPALPALSQGAVGRVLLGLEGTLAEVNWVQDQLKREWHSRSAISIVPADQTAALWQRLVEFPAAEVPLTLKLGVPPSAVARLASELHALDREVSICAAAGNGQLYARFGNFTTADVTALVVRRIQPAAAQWGGHVTVLRSQGLGDLTRQAVWGLAAPGAPLMAKVKQQFDPRGILNPGRFVY